MTQIDANGNLVLPSTNVTGRTHKLIVNPTQPLEIPTITYIPPHKTIAVQIASLPDLTPWYNYWFDPSYWLIASVIFILVATLTLRSRRNGYTSRKSDGRRLVRVIVQTQDGRHSYGQRNVGQRVKQPPYPGGQIQQSKPYRAVRHSSNTGPYRTLFEDNTPLGEFAREAFRTQRENQDYDD